MKYINIFIYNTAMPTEEILGFEHFLWGGGGGWIYILNIILIKSKNLRGFTYLSLVTIVLIVYIEL